jgi:hypothetical protein
MPFGHVEGRSASAVIAHGRIIDVHPDGWTVDVQLEEGSTFHNIPVASPYLHLSNGEGIYVTPEVEAHCLVLTRSAEGQRPIVLSYLPMRDVGGNVDDFSNGRGSFPPGSFILQGRDGNFVRLLRGGLLEVGASEGASTQYYPLSDLVRTIAQQHELLVSGSRIRFETRTAEASLDGPTGVQIDLQLQQFAEKAPLIFMQLGDVVEDRERRLADGEPGEIVARLVIYDQETVDRAEQANLAPNPDQAVTQIRFDQRGNVEEIYAGRQVVQAHGRRLYLHGDDVLFLQGNRRQEMVGNVDEHIGGDLVSVVDGSRTLRSLGTLEIECAELVINERHGRGRTQRVNGRRRLEVNGPSQDSVASNREETTGGGYTSTVVRDRVETTGGKSIHTVLHGDQTLSRLQDAVSSLLQVMDGRIRQHAETGSIEFLVGNAARPTCRLKIHNDPRTPQQMGRVTVSWPNGNQVTLDGLTGAMQLKNHLGEFSIGADGRTHQGLVTRAPTGKIVTTMTHPVCYVTGAPIAGCESCTASGPPGFGPAVAPLPPLPTTNLPEVPLP